MIAPICTGMKRLLRASGERAALARSVSPGAASVAYVLGGMIGIPVITDGRP
jgi:hypothetical protein